MNVWKKTEKLIIPVVKTFLCKHFIFNLLQKLKTHVINRFFTFLNMATFGLGFSQQEVNRKCRTVIYKDRYKNSKFKSLGKNVVRRMKVVQSMDNFGGDSSETEKPQAVTVIIGGEIDAIPEPSFCQN